MKQAPKIKSYLGFCIKAGKAVFGVDNIVKIKRGLYLIIQDKELGNASKRKLRNYVVSNNVELLELDIKQILAKENCKAVGLKEKNLANAIIREIKEIKQYE
ncbi:MAG: hypothetical protein QM214_05420 [Bacillota bacterium]|jgi:hypothetical protein|nr:hypothetical protein [Bacillota bacterium]HHU42842.1 hypothetical protein [Clostridiales bacterium]